PNEAGYYLASRWSCRDETGAAALDATCALMQAKTVTEGQEALGRISNSSWNWVLADRSGSIGYQMSGRMPIRRAGVRGLVPLPGWDPANDWQGAYPAEMLPRELNPMRGWSITANHDLNHLGKAHPINVCMASYRAERIDALLAPDRLTLKQMRDIQLDLYSKQAEKFMAVIR